MNFALNIRKTIRVKYKQTYFKFDCNYDFYDIPAGFAKVYTPCCELYYFAGFASDVKCDPHSVGFLILFGDSEIFTGTLVEFISLLVYSRVFFAF